VARHPSTIGGERPSSWPRNCGSGWENGYCESFNKYNILIRYCRFVSERALWRRVICALADLGKRAARFLLDEGPAFAQVSRGSTWPRASHRNWQAAGARGVRSDFLHGVAGGRSLRAVVGQNRPSGGGVRHALRRSPSSPKHTRDRGVGLAQSWLSSCNGSVTIPPWSGPMGHRGPPRRAPG
jgi:hypothetical protein